jgi:hypothetical protein
MAMEIAIMHIMHDWKNATLETKFGLGDMLK